LLVLVFLMISPVLSDLKLRKVFVSAPNMVLSLDTKWRVVCGSELKRQGCLVLSIWIMMFR